MKKLCSGLLVFSMALSHVGTSGCALEKNANFTPMVSQEKTSWLRENSQKNNTKTSNMEIDGKINEILNKEQAKNKKKAKKVTNVNIDLNVPAIALSAAILGSVALQEYAKSKRPNIFKQFYSATGESISSVWALAKGTVADLWSFGKEKGPAVVEWTKDKYDSLFKYVKGIGGNDIINDDQLNGMLLGVGTIVLVFGHRLVEFVVGEAAGWLTLPMKMIASLGCCAGQVVGSPVAGLVKGVKSALMGVPKVQGKP